MISFFEKNHAKYIPLKGIYGSFFYHFEISTIIAWQFKIILNLFIHFQKPISVKRFVVYECQKSWYIKKLQKIEYNKG